MTTDPDDGTVMQGSKAKGLQLLHRTTPEPLVPGRQPASSCGERVPWGNYQLDPTDLLPVVGGIREQSGDMEHDLIVLVRRVEGVGSRGVS